jgi:hypothetical protein
MYFINTRQGLRTLPYRRNSATAQQRNSATAQQRIAVNNAIVFRRKTCYIVSCNQLRERLMGRLTFNIPETAHQILRIQAASQGVTIKDLMLSKIAAEIEEGAEVENRLRLAMEGWETQRKGVELKRGAKKLRDVIHEGHKW